MRNYILTDDVLCFTSNGYGTYVVEKNKDFYLSIDCLKLLKYGCNFYGNSYNMIIFFPTCTPSSKKCIWLAYNNITRYVKESNGTKIYFDNGKEMNIKVPYTTIDNQITKCIKIEKYLNGIMRKTVEK